MLAYCCFDSKSIQNGGKSNTRAIIVSSFNWKFNSVIEIVSVVLLKRWNSSLMIKKFVNLVIWTHLGVLVVR